MRQRFPTLQAHPRLARKPARLIATLAAALCAVAASGASDGSSVSLEQLPDRAAATVRAAARRDYPEADIDVRMVPLDPRLSLEACQQLDLQLPGSRSAGRVTVHARCSAPAAWGIYLTAQVDIVLPVVTVAGPVPRDTVLRAGDLALQPANLADLRDGYLTDPAVAEGMVARTPLRFGAVLYQRQLSAPRMVTRGDPVTLAARRGLIVVTTQAIALSDGVYGDKVDVRNPRSDRVLSAWVVGPARVSTHP